MVCLIMIQTSPYAQHLSSSRSAAIVASTVFTDDIHSLDWNPAALAVIKNWEASSTAAYVSTGSNEGFLFQTVGIAKQYVNTQVGVLRLSPGIVQDFIVPSTISIGDSSHPFVTEFDKKISYKEGYALGYGVRLKPDIVAGLSLHFVEEKITDTNYFVDSKDSNFSISSSPVEYSSVISTVDAGLLWTLNPSWKFGLVGKNIIRFAEQPLPTELQQYQLNTGAVLRMGAGYTGIQNVLLGIDTDVKRQVRLGGEWTIANDLKIRGGMYIDISSMLAGEAIAFGIGTTVQSLRLDISYLAFLAQENRRGVADITEFLASGIKNIEFNPFSSDRLSLTAMLNFGNPSVSLAKIENVEMTNDIFPASRTRYAFQPVGKAQVKNISSKSIDAKVSFYVDRLMDAPTETRPYTIAPGEVEEIPFYAVFNDKVRTVQSLTVQDGDIYVNTSSQQESDDHYQTRVLVHGKNDWDGDVKLLSYFVVPDDPKVITFSREHLSKYKTMLDSIPAIRQNFEKARILFDEFAHGLLYVNDPKKSQDYVQYPAETLERNGGDCDDLSVCYAALLGSVGVSTAFIDVVPPNDPEQSHIYMIFNSGLDAQRAHVLSDNPKRYIIRRNEKGVETAWIPVETTAVQHGFEEAWTFGAKEYFTDTELNLGVVKGWVKIVDVGIHN